MQERRVAYDGHGFRHVAELDDRIDPGVADADLEDDAGLRKAFLKPVSVTSTL